MDAYIFGGMVFKKWKIKLLYVFAGLIIAGLVGVQVYWITNSIKFKKATLERNLVEDLGNAVKYAEEQTYCFSYNSKAYVKNGEGVYIIKQKWDNGNFLGPENGGYLDTLNLYNVFYHKNDTIFINDKAFIDNTYPATLEVTLKLSFPEFYENKKRFDSSMYNVSNLTDKNYWEILTNKFTVDEIINMTLLDSLIKNTLARNDLDTAYEAGIRKEGQFAFEYLMPGSQPKHLAGTDIKTTFLKSNNFNKPYELLLYVPGSFTSILDSMSVMMVSSVLIIIFLIISYVYFVRTILRQRELSDMKTTFINNITHEFRTPITNINLAIDNWREAGNRKNGYYVDIIEEENRHMERNVEQILQIATIEYPVTDKKFISVNMHRLIEETAEMFEIQLINNDGRIEYKFHNNDPHIEGNGEQLKNMIHNLIDNAIKYRNGAPYIVIATYDTSNNFVMQVDDNGVGMPPEVQKDIFKRFYRGYHGDKHDVKGFGLGLSYVKYIVDIHNGEIHVRSRQGKGTSFTIYLPKKNL